MDRKQLVSEIKRLKVLLSAAQKRAVTQYALIDKLTAASLHIELLLEKLRRPRERRPTP